MIMSPLQVGSHVLKNRLVALPVFTGYAHRSGAVSRLQVEHYAGLARSGVAMVVVANAAVSFDGVTSTHNLRIDHDKYIPGLAHLAKAIRSNGALSCIQLNHAGSFAKTAHPLVPTSFYGRHPLFELFSLKAFIAFFPFQKQFIVTRRILRQIYNWRKGMTPEEMQRVIQDFGEAAARAYEAGFDMIELHGATGYLLTQFLSAYTNKLESGYGGSLNKRMTYPLAVLKETKRRLPQDYPVGFRLLLIEGVPEGIRMEESIKFAQRLEKSGTAYLSATAGTYNSMFKRSARKQAARPAYLKMATTQLKKAVSVPVIISGRIITPKIAHMLLEQGAADLIGLGRAIIADPAWPRKIGREREIIACRDRWVCLKEVALERGLICERWPKWEQKRVELEHSLLKRGFQRTLMVAVNQEDLDMICSWLRFIRPANTNMEATLLFLGNTGVSESFTSRINNPLHKIRDIWISRGLSGAHFEIISKTIKQSFNDEIRTTIEQGGYDVILICKSQSLHWQKCISFQQIGQTFILLNVNKHWQKALVVVDISLHSLRMLKFLDNFLMKNPSFKPTFIHVLKDKADSISDQWEMVKKILKWDRDLTINRLETKKGISRTILGQVRGGKYGTVMMGKRESTGISGLILGSVSSRMLKDLTNESLFFIN